MFRFLVFVIVASVVFISCEKDTEIVRPNPELTMSYADFRDNAPAAPSANPLSYACYEFTNRFILDWIMIKQQEIGLIIHGSLVYQVGTTNTYLVHDPTGGPTMSFETDRIEYSQSQEVAIQDARKVNLKSHILFDCTLTDYTPEWFVYVDPVNNDVGDTTYQSYGAVTLNIDRVRAYAWTNRQLNILNDSEEPLGKNIWVSQPIMFFDNEADANAYRNMTNFRICLRNGANDFMTCLAELNREEE